MKNPEHMPAINNLEAHTVDTVLQFARENKVLANDKLVACGDDRYTSMQSKGAIRVFGADLGVLLATRAAVNKQALHIPPEDLYRRYKTAVKAVRGADAEVTYHSDSKHLEKDEFGCGHEGLSADKANTGKYQNLSPQDVRDIHAQVSQDENAERVILEGGHNPQGVLLVDNASDTKNPHSVSSTGKDGKMFFVVDKGRSREYVEEIVAAMQIDGITAEEVNKALAAHTTTTASLLAAGLEQYEVLYDAFGEPQVAAIGKVPAPNK